MAERWSDTRKVLEHLADHDLRRLGVIVPQFVAFEGDDLLFLADIRPFAGPDLMDALIELFALAFPLGADRIGFSLAGRAWSLEDPIPPVIEGFGDLRAHVQTILLVDGHDPAGPGVRSVIRPYHLAGDVPVWREPIEMDETPDCWPVRGALVGIERRGRYRGADPRDLRGQAQRCERLGHVLHLGVPGLARLVADELERTDLRTGARPDG